MDLRKKYQDVCEKLGWDLTDEGDGEVSISMQVGDKDYYFNVSADCFADAVRANYNDFAVDKQVEMAIEGHPYCGVIGDMLEEVAEARGNGESSHDLRVMLVEAGDDAEDICDKLNEVAKARGNAEVIGEVEGLLDWLVEERSDAQRIKDDLKELAEALEAKEREQVNIELDALTTPGADIRPEGMVLEVDDREVYADFLGCDMEALDTGRMDGPAEYLLEDVTFRDKKGGEEILLEEDELRYAALKAVHVRCDREEGLYFQPDSITITAQGPDSRLHQVMHDNSDRSLGHVGVHAADHGGNDWTVSDHKPDRRPGLDDLIKGAEGRAAAQDGKDPHSIRKSEQEL